MRSIVTCILMSLCFCVNAQDNQRVADDLVGFQDEDMNYEDLYENYLQLIAHPIDINSATPEALRLLNILSESQINSFFNYRNENGKLISIYELQAIEGLDLITIQKLLPFVTIEDPQAGLDRSLLDRILHEKNNYLITRYERTLERSVGYNRTEDDMFQGSQDKLYFRFRTSRSNDFSFGFTAEKDAGERLTWNPRDHQLGADFLSFHAQVMNKKKIKNLIAGDFQAQFGQGLILGSSFGLGKGGEAVLTSRKSNVGFLPYTSVNEGGFFRGIANSYEISRRITLSGFYSTIYRDASLTSDSVETIISTLLANGLHRNRAELEKRKNITESNYGAIVQYKRSQFDAGIILHATAFGSKVIRNNTPYNQFTFKGSENLNAGIYLNYTFRNINIFTEAARSWRGGGAIITGMLGSLDPKLDLALVYRRYERDFVTFYSNAFSENTTPQNETGIYWGWKYRINRRYNLSGYADLFTFPWLKFRSYKPAPGYEWLLRFSIQPSRKVSMYLQARQESKQRNVSGDANLYETSSGTKNNYCVYLDYEVIPHIRCKTRAQFSNYQFDNRTTSGMVILQDVIVSIGQFQISGRHALFDTDDFDNRQYVFENDVWLAYSLPAYHGVGIRNYFLVEYKLSKKASIWLRYSRTRYKNQDEIGSGLDKIEGNSKNDIKLQLLLRL
jgi:hypothetical protein